MDSKKKRKPSSSSRLMESSILFRLKYTKASILDVRSFKSVDELLVKLVYDYNDAEFRKYFLNSYRVFPSLDPEDLFEGFRTLWDSVIPIEPADARYPQDLAGVRSNIARVMQQWVSESPSDVENKKLRKRVADFVEQEGPNVDIDTRQVLLEVSSALSATDFKQRAVLLKRFVPSGQQDTATKDLLALASKRGAAEVAEQLTILEHQLFSTVPPVELLQLQWLEAGEGNAICAAKAWFGKVAGSIGSRIAGESNEKTKTALLKRAIAIATRSYHLRNFNLVMEVLTGLFRFTLECERAWENVNNRSFEAFIELCKVMTPNANFKTYHEEFNSTDGVRIPYMASVMSDLLFIDDFNDTRVSSGVNFTKARQLGSLVADALGSMSGALDIEEDPELLELVRNAVLNASPLFTFASDPREDVERSARLKAVHLALLEYYTDPHFLWSRQDMPIKEQKMHPRDWKVLEAACEKLHFKKDDVVWEPGQAVKVCMVKYGSIRVEQFGVTIRIIGEGTIFGDSSILEPIGKEEPSLYIADKNCMIQSFDPSLLIAMLASDARLAQRFFSHLARDLVHRLDSFQKRAKATTTEIRRKRSAARLLRARSAFVVKPTASMSNLLEDVDKSDSRYCALFALEGNHLVIKQYKVGLVGGAVPFSGDLYISSKHVCFYSKMFNYNTKVVVPMSEIVEVSEKPGKLILHTKKKRKEQFRFKDGAESDALALIQNLRGARHSGGQQLIRPPRRGTFAETSTQPMSVGIALAVPEHATNEWRKLSLSPENWEILLQGAKHLKFKPGERVIEQGKKYQRLFQVVKGKCKVERKASVREASVPSAPRDAEDEAALPHDSGEGDVDTAEKLAILSPGELFGEISFVRGDSASASVVANSHVDICVIEGTAINRLIHVHPDIGAKFLHYVCSVLSWRLYGRLYHESKEEASVPDIVLEQLHMQLENVTLAPNPDLTVLAEIMGPVEEEEEEEHSRSTARPNLQAAKAISTYPRRHAGQDRDGHPVCDRYKAVFCKDRVIAVIADGCNWGNLPRQAAINASNAFCKYMTAHQAVAKEVSHIGSLLLRAFAMAQAAVIGDDPDSPTGTTTLLGGVACELLADDGEGAGEDERTPHWGFVYASVGDTKAFHYSKSLHEWHDITESNRVLSRDATDCGGRLGRMTSTNGPDLRNFELGFFPCDEGDLFLLVSDGVHDNLDPESLGKNPRALGLDWDQWDAIPLDKAESAKSKFRLRLLRSLLNPSNDFTPDPAEAVNKLLEYCVGVNAAAVQWMCENPSKPLPHDYAKYPGKMDHTTCLAFTVGHRE